MEVGELAGRAGASPTAAVASGFCCEWTQESKVFTCWRCADLDLTAGLGVTLGDKWEHLAGAR